MIGMGLKIVVLEGSSLFWGGRRREGSQHSMNFYRKVVLLSLNFLSLMNLASHYMPWTSKEILALQKMYFSVKKVFFC